MHCSDLSGESAHGITADWQPLAVHTFGPNIELRESMLPLGCSQPMTDMAGVLEMGHFSPVQDSSNGHLLFRDSLRHWPG